MPGVNSQGATRDELLDNLRSALAEAIEMNRAEAIAAARRLSRYTEIDPMLARKICRHLGVPRP